MQLIFSLEIYFVILVKNLVALVTPKCKRMILLAYFFIKAKSEAGFKGRKAPVCKENCYNALSPEITKCYY